MSSGASASSWISERSTMTRGVVIPVAAPSRITRPTSSMKGT
jgi:hypothetical protein